MKRIGGGRGGGNYAKDGKTSYPEWPSTVFYMCYNKDSRLIFFFFFCYFLSRGLEKEDNETKE